MSLEKLEAKMRGDFKFFLSLVWRELDLPKPTRAQLAIADYLQHGPKRLQISAFRGVGKSWITAAFVLWVLFVDPDRKIMVISASKERADNFSIFCQKLILDIEWLSHLRPRDSDQRWSRISFDVGPAKPHQAPSVKSVGITGQMTGSRAHLMVFDDVEVPANSATDMQREKLLQLVSESESILVPDDDARIMFLGTPQSTFTIYRKLAERSYRPFVWPARYPRDLSKYEGLLAPQLVADLEKDPELTWKPTDTRFNELNLMERESAMGRSNFMLQFMLDTSLSDAEKFPLKFQDLIVTPLGAECAEAYAWSADPRYMRKELNPVGLPGDRFYGPMYIDEGIVPYSETIVSVDPSGRGTDETVAVVLSQANGYIFVRDMKAFRDGYSDETLSDIVRLGKRYKASKLLVESNFGDGMITELFKRHISQMGGGMDTEEVRASARKEERIIETLEPVMNQHKLIIDPKVWEYDYSSNPDAAPEKRLEYMLGYQMSRMCREKGAVKHDDRVDALSQGVQYYVDAVAQSAFKQQALRKHEEWKAMMTAFDQTPHLATDALVLGQSFKSLTSRVDTGVWEW
ncbi:terminase large subunit [Synechococcus phage Syn5]|uniref:Terminase, large subunit n=1 Tax=Synechococcus phage Syn5 TaxID=2914003 RepID=A4ZRE1_9CAUD|nr:terminase large subunit [Synechococcus phage Syn5]ABP87967.1 DNA packaging protein [Synechococcus phage Syn5]